MLAPGSRFLACRWTALSSVLSAGTAARAGDKGLEGEGQGSGGGGGGRGGGREEEEGMFIQS